MNKQRKLFSAPEAAAALTAAKAYFGCEDNELYMEELSEGSELLDGLYEAYFTGGHPVDTKNPNGDFNLFFEADGVYFEMYPPRGQGMEPEQGEIMTYIRRKGIEGLNPEAVLDVIKKGRGRVKIGLPQAEKLLNEEVAVEISADEMEASICVLPPDEGGAPISFQAAAERLREAGVTYGLSVIGIRTALKEKTYGQHYSVAKGALPEHGEDGTLIYHFDKNKKDGRPIEDGEGKVDYRNLDIFEAVKEGQLLITRTLATPGKPGCTVTGRELKPKPGREVNLPKTKNVNINEEKTAVYAATSGMVQMQDGAVAVSDVLTVRGDCDFSVGNIDFEGSVVIGGAVISGMSIKARGDITVGGIVNEAELTAGGNIELKRGIQGADKGKLTASGNITAAFIERAEVDAMGDVVADVIMHSRVEAGQRLILKGKRGNILGGEAHVGREVFAKTIGSIAHVQTDIEVGFSPHKAARLRFVREELERLEGEERKIQQLELYLSKAPNLTEEKRAAIEKSVVDTHAQNAQLLTDYFDECNRLEEEAENAVNGKVHCTVMAYPGTKISVSKGIYRVSEQTSHATFKYRNGEVIFTACEVSG